jgi:hypothetical protein
MTTMIDILLMLIMTAIVTAIVVRIFGRMYAKILVTEAYILAVNDIFNNTLKNSPDDIMETIERSLRNKIEKEEK